MYLNSFLLLKYHLFSSIKQQILHVLSQTSQSYVKKIQLLKKRDFFFPISYQILFFLKRKMCNQKLLSDNFQTSSTSQCGAKLYLRKLILMKSNRNLREKRFLINCSCILEANYYITITLYWQTGNNEAYLPQIPNDM